MRSINFLIVLIAQCRVDQSILQHMIETQAEFIMEVTDKTKADIKVTSWES